MTKIKQILVLLFIFLNTTMFFAESYESKVKSEYVEELKKEGFVRIIHKDGDTKLVLLPDCDYTQECLVNRVTQKEKLYTFVSESLYLLKKEDVLKSSNSSKTNISVDDISHVIRSISRMEGMTYYSYTYKTTNVLYKKSYMIDSLEGQNRIPDQNTGNANGQISYCMQHDHSFGECRYQLNYYQSDETFYTVFKNIDSMGLGIFKAVNPDDMRINIITEDCGDEILLYLEIEANCPKNSFIIKQMEVSMISRVEAIYKWFIVQFY